MLMVKLCLLVRWNFHYLTRSTSFFSFNKGLFRNMGADSVLS